MKIAVLGAGAWGTAMAQAAAAHHSVTLWARDAAQISALSSTRINARYLPDVLLDATLTYTHELVPAVHDAQLVIVATPTAALRATLEALAHAQVTAPIVWLCKGFESTIGAPGVLAHQIAAEVLGAEVAVSRTGPLSGPSFADEVARGLPTALTVAGSPDFCRTVTDAFHHGALRIYSTDDVIGVEVGGAVKNILAIATGVSDALALGQNARAALITRGLAEMTRLGVALGARTETFMGLTGVGDLVLTCTGALSRNRTVGLALGQGTPLAQALDALGHVAEGVRSAPAVLACAQAHGVDMPITAAVCALLQGQVTASQCVRHLLAREPKPEHL